jgi:tetratricopeptide (TPR) repeat protein
VDSTPSSRSALACGTYDPPPGRRSWTLDGALDGSILAVLVTIAVLLGIYELSDTDIWWHIRGGEWILDHRRPPRLDPFTFGSADRIWIDLHWLFEVVVALVFRIAGIPAVIFLAAAASGLALAIALVAQPHPRSVPLCGLCWIPTIVMMTVRVDPRPEMFSLVCVASFLAVLRHSVTHPRALWLLPVIQVVWVNMHGLFVFGPILFAMLLASQMIDRRRLPLGEPNPTDVNNRNRWRTPFLVGIAIAMACLVNPYGISGAILPLELFPKISDAANPYKSYINEFYSPLEFGAKLTYEYVATSKHFALLYFLLLFAPLTFVIPFAWRELTERQAGSNNRGMRKTAIDGDLRTDAHGSRTWLACFASASGMLLLNAVSLPGFELPHFCRVAGEAMPFALTAAFFVAAWRARRAWPATTAFLATGIVIPIATDYLRSTMYGLAPLGLASVWQGVGIVAGVATIALLFWRGTDAFGLLLVIAFGYLALQAMRNLMLFGLVAGVVVCWNMNGWMSQMMDLRACSGSRRGWSTRIALLALLVLAATTVVNGQYHAAMGDQRQFGIGERPMRFAHEAAEFAGGKSLPDRALVYDLGLASLYVFHNGPERKVFLDPRLEVPTIDTFRTYVETEESLERRTDDWRKKVKAIDPPMIVLDHEQHHASQATLLRSGEWRPVYFDALAAVFLPSGRDGSTATYPTIDFGLRHFRGHDEPSKPGTTSSAFYEARALVKLASDLRQDRAATWRWRIPMLLHALDRLDRAQRQESVLEEVWTLRGQCHWNLVYDLSLRPPSAKDGWHSSAALPWAQSTWCLRQALEHNGEHLPAWRSLYDSWRARSLPDAMLAVGQQLAALSALVPAQRRELTEIERATTDLGSVQELPDEVLGHAVDALITRGCAATACELIKIRDVDCAAWNWQRVDCLAAAWMHLGIPKEARELWQAARSAPSEAERVARIADSYLVEQEFERAEGLYQQALQSNPRLTAAWWGLATIYAQRGIASATLDACDHGLACDLTPVDRFVLTELKSMVASIR